MPRLKGFLGELLKLTLAVALFAFLQDQIIQVRQDLQGNANSLVEAQSRYKDELGRTRELIRDALDDSHLEFTRARRVIEESTERIHGDRKELERLIDDRTGAIASTLRDRLESERTLLEGARSHAETNAELMRKLERALDHDSDRMKRLMVFPTAQLRGCGTVGSGVIVYSELQGDGKGPQGDGKAGEARAVTLVLTAHHVVMEVMGDKASLGVVEEIRILGENDAFEAEVFSGDVVLADRERDLALLSLRSGRRFPHSAELASRETMRRLDIFTKAYAVGCPLGNRPLPSLGEVSSKSKVVGGQVFWMLNAPTFFGNSGGGIYLASSCQLIGISSMIYTYGKENPTVVPHMGLFVSMESIHDWLAAEGHSFVARRDPLPAELLVRYGVRLDRTGLDLGGGLPRVEKAGERETSAAESQR